MTLRTIVWWIKLYILCVLGIKYMLNALQFSSSVSSMELTLNTYFQIIREILMTDLSSGGEKCNEMEDV